MNPAEQVDSSLVAPSSPTSTPSKFWLPGWLRHLDKGLLALAIVFILTLPLFTPRIYASDEIKYFSYLHSILFDGDVDFTNEYSHFYDSNPAKYANFRDSVLNKLNEKGLPVNEGPVGSALLWSPWYGLGHLVALTGQAVGIKSFTPNGYSTPYVWAVTLASLFYGFAGLVFAYLFTRNFVPHFYAALGTITIWLGTGVLFYMSLTPPMSHANSLFLISFWLWLWWGSRGWSNDEGNNPDNFVAGNRHWGAWLALGVIGGLITSVREQDGIIMIIAAGESLYLYYKLGWQRHRLNLEGWWASVKGLFVGNLVFLTGLAVGTAPQIWVYLALNGRIGPGKTVGDKLQFFNPEVPGRFLGLLFLNPDHGMFWWWPITLPALVGLAWMLRERKLRLVVGLLLLAFVAELYISAAFQTWTMRGSFGPRRLVGISVMYILGLGYLLWRLGEIRKGFPLPRPLLTALCALFIVWNFGLIMQFSVIRTEQSRQTLDPARVVVDQFTVVPGKLVDTAVKFFTKRDNLYKT